MGARSLAAGLCLREGSRPLAGRWDLASISSTVHTTIIGWGVSQSPGFHVSDMMPCLLDSEEHAGPMRCSSARHEHRCPINTWLPNAAVIPALWDKNGTTIAATLVSTLHRPETWGK